MRLLNDIFFSRRFAALFLVVSVLFTVYSRYGGGSPLESPEVNFTPFNKAPELLYKVTVPLRRLAVGIDGTIYAVVHPRFQSETLKVVSIDRRGQLKPFPNEDWQRVIFKRPTALSIDRRGFVWVAEDHPFALSQPRIMAIDPITSNLVLEQNISRSVLPFGSSLSDIAVSSDGMHVVASDSSPIGLSSRLLYYDIAEQSITPKLVRHSAVKSNRFYAVVGGQPFSSPLKLVVHREGLNAVAFSADGQRLLFSSAANSGLFSLPTDVLKGHSDQTLASFGRVSRQSQKPWSEDVTSDIAGNIYITDAPEGRILKKTPNGGLTALVPKNTFVWPSGLAFGPDGGLYVSETALNHPRWRFELADVLNEAPFGLGRLLAAWLRGDRVRVHSFGIWRLDVGMAGVIG